MSIAFRKQIMAIGALVVGLCTSFVATYAFPQFGPKDGPIKVSQSLKVKDDSTVVIVFKMVMDKGWHVYAQDVTEGPTATTFNVEEISGCELRGPLESSKKPTEKYDKAFMANLRFFEESVEMSQTIHLNGGKYVVKGYLEYGACNDMACTPPTSVEFSYDGVKPEAKPVVNEKKEERKAEAEAVAEVPKTEVAEVNAVAEQEKQYAVEEGRPVLTVVSEQKAVAEPSAEGGMEWGWIFLTSFAAGLLALLTPCVWPIIPMTVSFFLKRSKDSRKGLRDSIIYGLSIIVIYMLLGLVVTAIFGPSALNDMSTGAVANLFFTALLVVFGLSFIGAFDISLPSSWSTAVDQKAESTTGVLSIFLMAFTLALVSFSCTGPIVGLLLVEVATKGSLMGPAIGMLGFSLALALPFTLFALFPSMLKKVPRSGSWMMTVKVVLGFIELAFALKFFSVADLAYGWGLLDREVFICIWASLALVLGLYLLGVVNITHGDDSGEEPQKGVGATRVMMGVVSLAFAIYLIPGLWGAPLNAVSAFCPPMNTQDFVIGKNMTVAEPARHLTNLDEALAEAKKTGKAVMVDFTGYGCVNCREMEQKVLSDPRVEARMAAEYVFVSLYVDDKRKLDEKEIAEDGSVMRTIGDKWSYLQRSRFGVNAQPYYVKLNADGEQIGGSYTYDENPEHFLEFMSEK